MISAVPLVVTCGGSGACGDGVSAAVDVGDEAGDGVSVGRADGVGVAVATIVGDGSAAAGVSDGWLDGVTVAVALASGDVSAKGVAVASGINVAVGVGGEFLPASATVLCTVRGLCRSAINVSPR